MWKEPLGQRTWGLFIFFGELAAQRWQKIFSEQIEKLFLICSDFFFEIFLWAGKIVGTFYQWFLHELIIENEKIDSPKLPIVVELYNKIYYNI